MNELVGKILKLKTPAKIGVTLAVALVIGLVYYQFEYADLSDSITASSASRPAAHEKASYEQRKVEYLAYRNELQQLQEEQRELLRVLPKKDEIASFLSSIQEQAELSGLEVLDFARAELPEELYVKIPVRMEVRGGFHAITKFFKNVSELQRIVNIENFSLIPERGPTTTAAARPA
jgi:type IV pilus assembly protein PilO